VTENELGEAILGCAPRVHRALGPGLLENAFESCLAHEFDKAKLAYQRQVTLPVLYDGVESRQVTVSACSSTNWSRLRSKRGQSGRKAFGLDMLFDIAVARIRPYDPK